MNKYYSSEQMQQFKELWEELGPAEIKKIEEGWGAVYLDIQANIDADPSSPEAQGILQRWDEMMKKTQAAYASKPGLWEAIGAAWDDGAFKENPNIPGGVTDFIERARAARS